MNMLRCESARYLKETKPQSDYFVGIDSDGTVFNTMELKHRECFCPVTIAYWDFEGIAAAVQEVIEYVNLYSRWRGINRWPAIIRIMEFLSNHPDVKNTGLALPDFRPVKRFVQSGNPMNTKGLMRYMEDNPEPGLPLWLGWSRMLDCEMKSKLGQLTIFDQAMACLRELRQAADMYVFTGSREEIVFREWKEYGIFSWLRGAAGQETGTKSQAIGWAFQGKYDREKALMIGDTLGDLEAASANGISFFPIFPGREKESWQHFQNDGIVRYFDMRYTGGYEQRLVAQFRRFFENAPPWLRTG